jgi:hypothetical protein
MPTKALSPLSIGTKPEDPASQEVRLAAALSAVIKLAGVSGIGALRAIRKVGETIELPEATAEASCERVRLRSLGIDEELRNAEGGGLSDAEFAKQLGIASRQNIHNYHHDKKIIRWSKGARNFRYPAWQILDHKLLPGLDKVLKILHQKHLSPLDIISILLTPMRDCHAGNTSFRCDSHAWFT